MHPIAARLAARIEARPTLVVSMVDIIRDGSVDGEIRVRALTVAEDAAATEAAVAYRKKAIQSLPERHAASFLEDPTFLEDAKISERLWRACRDHEDPSKPAFPDAEWMRRHLTVDEMGRIGEAFERVQRMNAKTPDLFTAEQRWQLVDTLADHQHNDWADVALSGLEREALADLLIWTSGELAKVKAELAAVSASRE